MTPSSPSGSFKNEFIRFLLESNVLRFGDFVTKSGRNTPYFINTGLFRTGMQISRLAEYYANGAMQQFGGRFNNLYGPAYKGIPLATACALDLYRSHNVDISYTFNRKEAKDHGEGGVFVGHKYDGSEKVLIIEDVITGGTSVRESMEILKNAGIKPMGLIVSVDRNEKTDSGKSALQDVQDEFGLETASLVSIDDILYFVKDSNTVKQYGLPNNCYEQILQYRSQYGAK